MHGLVVYVIERVPFAWDLSLENSADSYLRFRLALLHSMSYFFFLYRSPSLSLCTVFDSISSNIDEVLSINPYANVFFFGDFNLIQVSKSPPPPPPSLPPPISFSPVTSMNVGINPQNVLTFSCNPFPTLV